MRNVEPHIASARFRFVRGDVRDVTKAREVLGFTAKVPLEEGLPRAARWQAAVEGLPFPGEDGAS